jgi:tRNA dimethylallyltransferase
LNKTVPFNSTSVITAPVFVLVGPTAVGKTDLSIRIAERYGCEIVSVDSMQVYRYMDIGTAKPPEQERKGIPHHLIDIADPDEQYNAARFVRDAVAAIRKIIASGKIPLLTGGTGLYLKALTQGLFEFDKNGGPAVREQLLERLQAGGRGQLYEELREVDPESAARIHVNDTQRLIRALEIHHATGMTWSEHLRSQPESPVSFARILQAGLQCDRRVLHNRIEERTIAMFRNGLLKETAKLLDMGYDSSLQSMQAIGYRHAVNFLNGAWDRDETLRLLIRDTRRYAKRQMTWFAKNQSLHWFERSDNSGVLRFMDNWLGSEK